MSTRDTRDRRPLIFLAVFMFHAAIVLLLTRAARLPISPSTPMKESLVLLLLPRETRAAAGISPPRRSSGPRKSAALKARPSKPTAAANSAAAVAPEPPKIDLEKAAEMAVKNAMANADRDNSYRNLSALSPQQLSWVRQNHLEPAQPGIPWTYRVVEITEGGFPIIHINDHCVAIPFLMMMVFCKIGHIEPRGDLFEHMRDPRR